MSKMHGPAIRNLEVRLMHVHAASKARGIHFNGYQFCLRILRVRFAAVLKIAYGR